MGFLHTVRGSLTRVGVLPRTAQTTTEGRDTSCRVRTSDFRSPLALSSSVISAQPSREREGPRTQAQHCQICGCSESPPMPPVGKQAQSLWRALPALLGQAAPPWSRRSCRWKHSGPAQDLLGQLRASFSQLEAHKCSRFIFHKEMSSPRSDQGSPLPGTSSRQAGPSSSPCIWPSPDCWPKARDSPGSSRLRVAGRGVQLRASVLRAVGAKLCTGTPGSTCTCGGGLSSALTPPLPWKLPAAPERVLLPVSTPGSSVA